MNDNSVVEAEVVDVLEEKDGQVWCPEKEQWKSMEVCQACPDRLKCARPPGVDRQAQAKDLDMEIERLKTAIFDNYYDLGQTLREVREGVYYKELGYESMNEYADQKHGFRYRKAAYLIAIVENCEAAGIEKEDVRGIEWSKMKELPELTEENRAGWLKKASDLSVDELKAEVKKSNGEEPREEKIFMGFSFDVAQKEVVDRAFELATLMTGSDVRSYHLQILAEEFISTYGPLDQAATDRFRNLYGSAEPTEGDE